MKESQISNLKFQIFYIFKIIGNYKLEIINWKLNKGFSLIELLISMFIFGVLIGIITLNLNTAQHTTTLTTTLETLITDLNHQQIKAMVGDTEGRTAVSDYGLRFNSTNYTLFHGSYSQSESTNFSIELPLVQQIDTTFANDEIIFEKGSGEILNFDPDENTITITDIANGRQRSVELNRLGVVTGVN